MNYLSSVNYYRFIYRNYLKYSQKPLENCENSSFGLADNVKYVNDLLSYCSLTAGLKHNNIIIKAAD